MPRSSSGTYTAPATGRPVQTGTAISSNVENTFISDISTEMTDSLSRSGKGSMNAVLGVTDGTVASPGIQFTNEPGSGLYRIGSSDIALAVNTAKLLELTSTGASVTGTFTASGAVTCSTTLAVTGNASVGGTLGVTGNSTFSGTLGVTGNASAGTFVGLGAFVAAWAADYQGSIQTQKGSVAVSLSSHPSQGVYNYNVAGLTASCAAFAVANYQNASAVTAYGSPGVLTVTVYSGGGVSNLQHTVVVFAL